MLKKQEMIAMLLAGGQGNRLKVLTQDIAKPAVPFGGKYRIIDFTLSNCVNSHIYTVGVLTQYRPLILNAYIGNGQPWDLDRMNQGVSILPPYVSGKTGEWYKGTAHAIYQNIHFVEQYDPEYVLILSGDHIYKMDYQKMLEAHKAKNADVTISVLEVPLEEGSRFGIMNTDANDQIYEFEEKPECPKSNKASMGVYIFRWDKLKDYLIADAEREDSVHDFGKNIIPQMLADGNKMFAYPFKGYWKDVGTVESFWEANMDLLNSESTLRLKDPHWRIYSRHEVEMPHFIQADSHISNSMITEGCEISGNISNSVLFPEVKVEKGAAIEHATIMKNVRVGKGAQVKYAIIADDAVVEEGAVVGASPEECLANDVVWEPIVIGTGQYVKRGEVITPQMRIGRGM